MCVRLAKEQQSQFNAPCVPRQYLRVLSRRRNLLLEVVNSADVVQPARRNVRARRAERTRHDP